MISLRENIDKVKFTDLITARIPGVKGKNCQIASERGRVAGEIDYFLRRDFDQARERPRGHTRSRRVEHNQVRPFVPVLEKSLHSGWPQIRRGCAAGLKIGFEIASGGGICFHRDQPFEAIRERHAEKSYAGEKVECQL